MIKKPLIYQYLNIDFHSANPKYMQLANCIKNAIAEGAIKKDEILPSINELSFEFEISRDTAEKGYKYLKQLGILGSVPGKGYFVKNTEVDKTIKICLLFNKLSAHKKIVYDAFVRTLAEQATIDFFIYNNDFNYFKKLVANNTNDYDYYVVIPHFLDGAENAYEVLNTIPKEKLLLLDKLVQGVTGDFAAVYENFEKDIFETLEQAKELLSKYEAIKIIFPEASYYPNEILKGFLKFGKVHKMKTDVIKDINTYTVKKGEVYINLMEGDLVTLVENILKHKLKVGKDVGVISYNETPLKKIILNGITTISTNFEVMGAKAAEAILNKSLEHYEVPFKLTVRPSI
ncbi:GntR family transcriptional regulator [Polluticaenibacter yanchengensis]|uniref:GntR family transcriptional regulator n=1 Tax=Polluticaenibacter yanchengensis TaxID=3014562 RepID=A0ABT4ULY7_9BACT|nr:GntR family transcriptional regulator [Chitinophagaceae bacterium LY-5]